MNSKTLLVGSAGFFFPIYLSLLLFTCSLAQSQYLDVGQNAIDVPVDPQSAAMGESFVAMRNNPAALFYNPATISGFKGLQFTYSHRNFDILPNNDLTYHSYLLSLSLPTGSIGIFYNDFTNDNDLIVTSPAYPEGTGEYTSYKNYVYGAAYGKDVSANFDIGITLKAYNYSLGPHSGHAAYLADIGTIYHTSGPISRAGFITDEFNAGISIQNFGTDHRYDTTFQEAGSLIKLPRYLRIGYAYRMTIVNEDKEKLTPIGFLFTGEYRNLLNAEDYQSSERDYWGFGTQATLYEILSLRLGSYISGTPSYYGQKGVPSIRYGFGVHLPLNKIGLQSPIAIIMDYGVIPGQFTSNSFFTTNLNPTLRVFSFGIWYESSFFPEARQ